MPKAKNPRRIVNAGALIGEALAPRELGLLVTVVQSAKATVSEAEAKTLSLTLAKPDLRRRSSSDALLSASPASPRRAVPG
jgi:hypothetical protein